MTFRSLFTRLLVSGLLIQAVLSVGPSASAAQTATAPRLVADVNMLTMDSEPENLVTLGASVYFFADDGETGRELWKSDGTEAGTTLVADVFEGPESSEPSDLTVAGTSIFFIAFDFDTVTETYRVSLWKVSGAGVELVRSFDSGDGDGPSNLTAVGATLYFTVNDGTNGTELWKSDGTEAGTVIVEDINLGPNGSSPDNLTAVGATLYFTANDGANGTELWKSDGTELGTVIVEDINLGPNGSSPYNFGAVGATLYFAANDGTSGTELWKSDGTELGTVIVKDIRGGSNGSSPDYLTNVGGTLYFVANDGVNGTELWKSDGTEAGTALVKDIGDGEADSYPDNLTAVGATLYFTADDDQTGTELWKSDGSGAGTVRVKDINVVIQDGEPFGSDPYELTAAGTGIFFAADDGSTGIELWKSDGSGAGTALVKDINDSTQDGEPQSLVSIGSTAYFSLDDGIHGRELWKSDGTGAGTVLVKDACPGRRGAIANNNDDDADTHGRDLVAVGGKIFFLVSQCESDNGLWVSDGTEAGTKLVKSLGNGFQNSLTAVNGKLIFFYEDGGDFGFEPWVSNGTEAGTVLLKDINAGPGNSISNTSLAMHVHVVDGTMYFFANDTASDPTGFTLWKTDGTGDGTVEVSEDVVYPGFFTSGGFASAGETLFVVAASSSRTNTLWVVNGSVATNPTADFNRVGRYMAVIGSTLFFAADEFGDGRLTLWRFEAGAVLEITPVVEVEEGSSFSPIVASSTHVYVSGRLLADRDTTGFELWKSDGTGAGTMLVEDVIPGGDSRLERLTAFGDHVYFSVDAMNDGPELLWFTTGLSTREVTVDDESLLDPRFLTKVGDRLFFSASTPATGQELWIVSAPVVVETPLTTVPTTTLPSTIVPSTIVPVAPANAAPSRGSINVAEFSGNSSRLTTDLRIQARRALARFPQATSVRCRGFVRTERLDNQAVVNLARDRARAVCDYLRELKPSLQSTVARGAATDGRRRVALTFSS